MTSISKIALNNAEYEIESETIKNSRTNTSLNIWQGTEEQWTNGISTTWYYWESIILNFTNVGNVSISNRIASDFSNNSYLQFPSQFNPGNNSWEVGLKFTTGNDVSTSQGLFTSIGTNGAAPYFISSGKLQAYFYNNGTVFLDLFSLDINTEYTIKAVFDGSSYKWYSLENSEWVLKYTLNSSASVFGGRVPVLGNDKGSESPFLGSIDLSECYVKIDNSLWWEAYTDSQAYTLNIEPQISDTVYSLPETISSLTITSVGTGSITLSDNKTYYYNQSGNIFTYQTIGDAHPDYLCFINNVGIKIGNTMIATNSPITTTLSSSSTNNQASSAKVVYDTVGEIESTINTIRGV